MKRWLSLALISTLLVSLVGVSQSDNPVEGPLGDYGDAPEGTSAEYVHNFDPDRTGEFPSLFRPDAQSANPDFVLHRSPQEQVYLGQLATTERNALQVNRDLDDGWEPSSFVTCSAAALEVFVTVPESADAEAFYLNALFDWDHDGQWSGATACSFDEGERRVEEWSLRNLRLDEAPYNLEPGFEGFITLPAVTTGSMPGELWTRLTVTTTPVDEDRFPPAAQGGRGWTGVGDYDFGETEDYFTCLIFDADKPLEGCPAPLTTQQPIDPPPGDQLPEAQDDRSSTSPATPADVDILVNDSDPAGRPLTVTSTTPAANGSVRVNPDGTVTYTPNSEFTGQEQFNYTVCNPDGLCDTATVVIDVAQTNDAPVAADDDATTEEDSDVTVSVLDNDVDPDGDPLTVVDNAEPTNGTVSCTDVACTYTPDDGFVGTDTFTYTISDGNGGTDTATVTISVTAVNDPPTANDDSVSTAEDTPVTIGVLTNDTDPDDDALTITDSTSPSNGSVTCSATSCEYTPNSGFTGTDTFTYTISDGNGGTDTATVTISVNLENGPPVANDDSASTDEDSPVTVSVLANDSDPDGDTLTISGNTAPSNGSATCSSTDCQYTPNPDFNGTDSFTYTIDDGNGETDTATVVVTVNPVNDPPVANDDSTTTDEDTSVDIAVLSNDTDPEGDTLTVTTSSSPSDGTVNCSATTCSYDPDPDFNGTDSFTYTVSDGNGGTDTATVTIAISAVNDPPVASDDADTTDEDTPVTVSVLANDSDPENDSLTITGNTSPSNGAVSCTTSDCTYTPDENFNGTDQFSYTIGDGNGGTDTATVSITVNAVNDPPTAVDDSTTTSEGSPVDIAVLTNDADPDGDALEITSNTGPSNGSVTCTASSCNYDPDTNFNGSDSFTYTISDGNGGTDTATVTITVDAVNDAPTANDDADTTDEDTSVTIDVLANDSDPEGDPLTVTSHGSAANGSVSCTAADCTYDPDDNFNGTDQFSYTISDGNGGTDTATVTITIEPVNDAPIARDDAESTSENSPVSISVLSNDTDPEGDTLTVTSSTTPSNGSVTCSASSCEYTPNAGFTGTDSFDYTVSDGNGGTDTATVTINVNSTPDPPVANNDSETTDEDMPVTIDVLANDSDPDGDPLEITGNTSPSNGTVSCTASDCTYEPNDNFNGTDQFTYTISDGNGGTDTATVTITVNAVNDPPTAVDDSATTSEDSPTTISVLANDSDPDGDTLTVTSSSSPSNGSVSCSGGNCTYTPDENFNGTDSFTYTVSDGNGGTDTATVTITVSAVNDAPTANDDADTTDEDTPVTVSVLANDTDPENDPLTVTSHGSAANGTVSCTASDCTYTPNSNFNGTDQFSYTISDGNGGTDTATVTITIEPVNDGPTAVDDTVTVDEDSSVSIPVTNNDTDPEGDSLEITTHASPSNGSVTCSETSCEYTPDANFNGTDQFTYTITDGDETDTATVTVTVEPTNDAPTAEDGSYTTDEDQPVSTDLVCTDIDGDSLSYNVVSGPSNGSLAGSGNERTYTPSADFNGTDSFQFQCSDGNGGTDTGTITVTVNPVNDPPNAQDDTAGTAEDSSVTIPVINNDTDPDGDSLTITGNSSPSDGNVSCSSGDCTYTPTPDFNGTDQFTYTISDGNGGTDTATVRVTIEPVNDDPTAEDDSVTTPEDQPIDLDLICTDVDGDGLTVSISNGPDHGSLTGSGANWTYTPDTDFNGSDEFTFTCSDGNGGSDTGTIDITVTPVNDPPTAQNDADTTAEDQPVTVDVLANDSDIDGDPLEITGNTSPSNGTVSCTASDCTYEPNDNFNGTDQFTYTVSDGNGGTDTGTVDITVNPVNDAPVAEDGSATTDEDTSVDYNLVCTDVDGDSLTFSVTSGPSHGTLSGSGSSRTYSPDANYNGSDSFTYECSDGNGGSDTGTVDITVNPVNDAPVAEDGSATTDEDSPVNVNLICSDVDGDSLAYSIVSGPSHGTLSGSGNSRTYTPDSNYNGSDSFTYECSDGNGGTSTGTIDITVNPVNDSPVANDDSASTTEGNPVTLDVLANDSDPDGDSLSIDGATSPANGNVSCSDGSCTYTPNGGFTGTDNFDYTVSDGNGGTDTATVSITVDPNPLCDADPVKDTSLELSWGSVSVSDDTGTATLSVTNTGQDDHAVNLEIRIEATNNGAAITSANPSLPHTWDVGDLAPGATVTRNVEITVDRSFSAEDFEVKLSAEATNEDCRPGHTEGRSDNVDFAFTGQTSDSDNDGIPDSEDNCPNEFGVPENNGCPAAPASCTGDVKNNPDPGDNERERNVGEDNTVKTGSEDVDETNDLSESSAIKPANYDYTYYYCYTWTMDGYVYAYEYVYEWTLDAGPPNPQPNPTPPSDLNDHVNPDPNPDPNPPNTAPTASDDSATTQENSEVTIDAMANDSDPDATNNYWWASSGDKTLDPSSVKVTNSPSNGSTAANNDGTITYTPESSFAGDDSFTYQICDGSGKCDTATVSVTVQGDSTTCRDDEEDDDDDGDNDDDDDDGDDDEDCDEDDDEEDDD